MEVVVDQVVAVAAASVVDPAVGIAVAVGVDRVAGIVVAFAQAVGIAAVADQAAGTVAAGFVAETSFPVMCSVPASWQLGVVQTSQELEPVVADFVPVPSWPPVAGRTNQERVPVAVVAAASCLSVAAAGAVAKEDTCCHSHQQPANKHCLDCCRSAYPLAVEFVAAVAWLDSAVNTTRERGKMESFLLRTYSMAAAVAGLEL